MAPSALRSFTIAFAIVIAIIEPEASGFTIYTSTEKRQSNAPITDHTQLQVINDLSTPNNTGKEDAEDASKQTRDKRRGNEDKYTYTTTPLTEAQTRAAIETTTESFKTTEFVKAPTIYSDTIEVFDSVEDVTENKTIDKHAASTSAPKHEKKDFSTQSYQTTAMKYTTTITEIPSETSNAPNSTVTDQMSTETEPTVNDELKQEMMSFVTESSGVSTETMTIEKNTENNTSTSATTTPSSINNDTIHTNSDISSTTPSTSDINTSNDTEVTSSAIISITDATSHGIDQTINKTSTEPSWKKYTDIDRKRVTSVEFEPITKNEQETMQADTSNSHVEKSYSFTQIPVRSELVPKTEQMMFDETAKVTVGIDSSIPSLNTIVNEGAKRTEIIEAKRGGFINFSEKATTPLANEDISRESQYTDASNPIIDSEAPDFQMLNKHNSSTSQSRLAEDAIQEELLKEEAFNNQRDNEREEKRMKPPDEGKPKDEVGTKSSVDSLSVQLINYERTKTTLYTISPNYKPMKKIDVQPAKPFIRDPDDNSWRNESISSLGIVFKPKNASKSFKEVLKNKTQVELNNMQEKDSKEDLPHLRVRLEKIAEGRKTKRKKIIKDGEEVYTDYEESSAENSRDAPATPGPVSPGLTPAITATTPGSTSVRPEVDPTSPATTTGPIDNKTEKTMSKLDLFQSLGLKTLTTEKAKKMFNIAEYYDTTDDYDADYVKMSKIDIKKQLAMTPRATERPHTAPPRPAPADTTRPQFPDRRPTVQYFPPRPTQRVSLNKIDAEFERKVNMFAFKEVPARVPPPWPTADESEATTRPPARPPPFDTEYTTRPPVPSQETIPPYTTEDHFNRGAYIIKHFRDFLEGEERAEAPLDAEGEGPADFDYEAQFRADVLSRFVDNFNANSERFRADFPVVYNSSVRHAAGGGLSRASLRRLDPPRDCPRCDVTVELSPAYELQYYAPADHKAPRDAHHARL